MLCLIQGMPDLVLEVLSLRPWTCTFIVILLIFYQLQGRKVCTFVYDQYNDTTDLRSSAISQLSGPHLSFCLS
jgi:hypothetical protein